MPVSLSAPIWKCSTSKRGNSLQGSYNLILVMLNSGLHIDLD